MLYGSGIRKNNRGNRQERRELAIMRTSTNKDDTSTTVEELRALVRTFVSERDWEQFHSPKNLSMALAIEAAELMEHFQWISTDASRKLSEDDAKKNAVAEELSDVVCYALALANAMGIDVTQSLTAKIAKNAKKYPIAEFRGRFGKEDL